MAGGTNANIPLAGNSTAGLFSPDEKSKLSGISERADVGQWTLNGTSVRLRDLANKVAIGLTSAAHKLQVVSNNRTVAVVDSGKSNYAGLAFSTNGGNGAYGQLYGANLDFRVGNSSTTDAATQSALLIGTNAEATFAKKSIHKGGVDIQGDFTGSSTLVFKAKSSTSQATAFEIRTDDNVGAQFSSSRGFDFGATTYRQTTGNPAYRVRINTNNLKSDSTNSIALWVHTDFTSEKQSKMVYTHIISQILRKTANSGANMLAFHQRPIWLMA